MPSAKSPSLVLFYIFSILYKKSWLFGPKGRILLLNFTLLDGVRHSCLLRPFWIFILLTDAVAVLTPCHPQIYASCFSSGLLVKMQWSLSFIPEGGTHRPSALLRASYLIVSLWPVDAVGIVTVQRKPQVDIITFNVLSPNSHIVTSTEKVHFCL